MRRACDRIIHWGLVALIVFTPLAFGTVEAWAIALMEWGIITLVLVFALSRLWPSGEDLTGVPSTGGSAPLGLVLPIGLFLLLVLGQMVPMPMSWLKAVSPGSARMYTSVDVHDWEQAQDVATDRGEDREDPLLRVDEPGRRPISVNPGKTLGRFLMVCALVALFFMVARWADERRIVSVLKAVTVVGFLVAAFGLIQLLTWNGRIYWVRRVPTISTVMPTAFGPFVNHDHFAGYIEMIIPVALSLAFWLVDKKRRPAIPASPSAGGWTAAIRNGPPEERGRFSQGSLAIFAAVILIVSLFFSLSRGGILSAFISGAILLALLSRRIASRRARALVTFGLPAIVLLMIAWIGAEAVRKQMGTYANLSGEASFQVRAIIWRRLVQELPAYAWVGAGLGTFEDSFAPLTPAGSMKRWDKAHNDYLHLLWETGAAGGACFLLGAAAFVRRYWWPALRARARPIDLFGVGMAISLLSIALHSVVDFSLQLGANGFLCALLAGLIVALRRTEDRLPPGRASVWAVEDLRAK